MSPADRAVLNAIKFELSTLRMCMDQLLFLELFHVPEVAAKYENLNRRRTELLREEAELVG